MIRALLLMPADGTRWSENLHWWSLPKRSVKSPVATVVSALPVATVKPVRVKTIQMPEGGLSCTATVPGSGLQQVRRSLPIENKFGTQVDTYQKYSDSAGRIGQKEVLSDYESDERRIRSIRERVIGYVPIQMLNLSL